MGVEASRLIRVLVSFNVFSGLYPPRAKLAIQKYLSQLADNEQVDIFERVQVRVNSLVEGGKKQLSLVRD